MLSRLALALFFGLLFALANPAFAQPGQEKDPLSFDAKIRPIIRRRCAVCHNADDPSGDVNLAQDENPRLLMQHRKTWVTALRLIRSGEMPPEDEVDFSDEDRKTLIAYLEKTLNDFDCGTKEDPGTPITRRLTRHQYNLAVQDLTGLDIMPADSFSPDPVSYGFSGIGTAMGLSTVQVEQYADAARRIVASLVESRQTQPQVFNEHLAKSDKVAAKGSTETRSPCAVAICQSSVPAARR